MARESARYNSTGTALQSFGETLRQRIKAAQAVDVLNDVITGEIKEISGNRLKAVMGALNKCLPDLKAVAVAVHNDRPTTKADIDAMLMEVGLQPTDVFENTNSSSSIDSGTGEREYTNKSSPIDSDNSVQVIESKENSGLNGLPAIEGEIVHNKNE